MAIDSSKRRLVAGAGALMLASAGAIAWAKPKERVIRVVAKKFVFVPSEIRVKKGETVLLQFSAPEVPMGVNFADLHMRADVFPGKVAELRITPQEAGTFTFLCDVFCGTGHEDMSGTLIVSE